MNNKNFKHSVTKRKKDRKREWRLPSWSSGYDSVLPMQGPWVQSLVRELDLTCHN